MLRFGTGTLVAWRSAPGLTGLLLLLVAGDYRAVAQPAQMVDLPPETWSTERAVEHLRWYPRDSFMQYVLLQLAAREGKTDEVSPLISRFRFRDPWGRQRRVDLFAVFSGALAVQESMQLEVLGNRTRRDTADPPVEQGSPVPLEQLRGPKIKSHPWKRMLGDRKPRVSNLARCVPHDFYFVRFRSVDKLLTVLEEIDRWGRHLMSQVAQQAYSYESSQRAMEQLALPVNPLARRFYGTVVEEIAVTGSDPYLRIGSDVTVLIRFRHPQVFKPQVKAYLDQAAKEPDAVIQEEEYRGVRYVHVGTPDRRVHVYSAYPRPDLLVRSNSLPAFRRVLDVVLRAPGAVALGETDEFRYVRTLMPLGAKEEDGLVYLSDAFMRRLVGPRLKLTHRRRMLCYNHLRMLTHAAGLYWLEHRKAPASLQELYRKNCAPGVFGRGKLRCPDGGAYQLASGGLIGTCSLHGRADRLTPCLELPLEHIRPSEAELYRQFVARYSRYWRTFFDPIAVRVKVEPKQFRAETLVLPLLDNSIYQNLVRWLGPETKPLDLEPVYDRDIFTLGFKLNKKTLAEVTGLRIRQHDLAAIYEASARMKRIAEGIRNWRDMHSRFPPAVLRHLNRKPVKHPYSWRVAILPYIGQQGLYRQYRFDEPWNSPNNLKLLERMPEVFRSPGDAPGETKTRYQVLVGPGTLFDPERPQGESRLPDREADTLLLIQAAKKVPWTKPEDVLWSPENPVPALGPQRLVVTADLTPWRVPERIAAEPFADLATRTDTRGTFARKVLSPLPGNVQWFDMPQGDLEQFVSVKLLEQFLDRGIGDRIAIHVCDSDLLFDLQLVRFLALVRDANLFDPDMLPLFLLVTSLNSPVYLTVPVKDAGIVDRFLEDQDRRLAALARQPERSNGIFLFQNDFHREPVAPNLTIRTLGWQLGPVKLRLYWARLGQMLCVASRADVLEDLAELYRAGRPVQGDLQTTAHAFVRLRPENWNKVLPHYRRGWGENHRQSCLDNLGRLESLAQLAAAQLPKKATAQQVRRRTLQLARQFYGVRFYCPEGGHYSFVRRTVVVSPPKQENGEPVLWLHRIPVWQAQCSLHHSARDPHQGGKLNPQSATDFLTRQLGQVTLTLTFLKDGLRAVVTIRRK